MHSLTYSLTDSLTLTLTHSHSFSLTYSYLGRTVNVDVGEVKEAKDAQENGQAPLAGGEKKQMQLQLY